jgi:hypothetical protein
MTNRVNAIPADGDVDGAGFVAGRLAGRATSPRTSPARGVDYRIDHIDRLRPFLVSVVSDADLWMYLSSNGALTAGRNNEDRSLFPYETDDKLHQLANVSGPMTVLRVHAAGNGKTNLWRPFHGTAGPAIDRAISKATLGNRVTFEERHHALGLTFSYTWHACDAFGWVRTCELVADVANAVGYQIDLVDGVTNLLPAHAELGLQRASSCLLNAYSQCELDVPSNLAIYSMTSRITDKADPAEALFANVAFAAGLPGAKRWLSTDQLEAFIDGLPVADEHLITGRRPAFLVSSRFELGVGQRRRWRLAIDAHRNHVQVTALQSLLSNANDAAIDHKIDRALDAADKKLAALIAAADGQQHTADTVVSAHHASNVLFNCMRGGALADNDELPIADFARALAARNRDVAERAKSWLATPPTTIRYGELLGEAASQNDPQLLRLAMEYLPLTFGRRHGDPSRPWNRFDIRVTNDDGSPVLSYQGNWRDIFQNWEALAASYPVFLESMIAKFVNATTREGFNPYRVTKNGVEYEVPDPHDPWSHIGYWGDHQIVYLLKLLEASRQTHAGALDALLGRKLFAFADVPYRFNTHAQMLAERRETLTFDWDRHRAILADLPQVGTDARLVRDASGEVVLVTLAEKLLVPALSKLSSFVAGAGIWMNTQRPEWNDANNALVGNGVSMVTLCYLRRYCAFCQSLFTSSGGAAVEISTEVIAWLDRTLKIMSSTPASATTDSAARRTTLDALGESFEAYRTTTSAGDAEAVCSHRLSAFFEAVLPHLDATIAHNRRKDGLYHSYNLLEPKADAIEVDHLDVMLEGQVAVLSSGALSVKEAADVVERMFKSGLWREDQQSFMLYPVRELPGFMQKNAVEEIAAMRSATVRRLLKVNDRSIVHRDGTAQVRFHSAFRNARDVSAALDAHGDTIDATGRAEILDLYEKTFGHHAFTGRSGTMYGYEGIGCIYWHMVAKLLLAVQENVWRAIDTHAAPETIDRLATLYTRVRSGLGFNKTAAQYGAFPLDAYSHTPMHAGAQQPGMTGQVKEEILTRLGELGVRVADGVIHFTPWLLEDREFLTESAEWAIVDGSGAARIIELEPGTLGFTFAGTPIVYRMAAQPSIEIRREDGSTERCDGTSLSVAASREVLSRNGSICRIEVSVPAAALRRHAGSLERAFGAMSHPEKHSGKHQGNHQDIGAR